MTTSNSPATANEDTIDLKELFFALWYQWHIITLCVILSLIAALIYLKITPATYSVDAKIQMIDNKPSGLAGLNPQLASLGSLAGINIGGGQQSIQTEIEVLKSRAILGKTIAELHLDTRIQPSTSLWHKLTRDSDFQTQYSAEQIKVSAQKSSFTILKFDVPKKYLDKPLRLTLQGKNWSISDAKTNLELLKGNLNTAINSHGWQVHIYSQNELNGNYEIQKQSIPAAISTLLQNLNASEKTKQAGIIEVQYRGTDKQHIINVLNHIVATYQTESLSTKSNEKAKSLDFLNKQLPQLKQELEEAEKQFNAFRKQHGTIDVQQESALYLKQSTELETQKIQLEQKQAQLAAQYTSDHPMMREIEAQIGTLNNKINQLNSTLKNLPNLQSEYLQHYRDVEIKTQLYTNLLASYQSLSLAKAGESDGTRILDYPVEPNSPVKPKKLIVLILAVFVGGFIGVLIALTRLMMLSGVRSAEEIKTLTNLTTYVELTEKRPFFKKKTTQNIELSNLSAFIPTLLFKLAEKNGTTILVSSVTPNIHQTHIAQQFALALSQSNKRVLLVDTDIQQGNIANTLSLSSEHGLADYLQGISSFAEVIQDTETSSTLKVVARGQSKQGLTSYLNNEKLQAFISEAKNGFDYIVLSTAPILAVADSLVLAQYSDFNLSLVEYGKTSAHDLTLAQTRFTQTGVVLDGVILHHIPSYQIKNYAYGYHTPQAKASS